MEDFFLIMSSTNENLMANDSNIACNISSGSVENVKPSKTALALSFHPVDLSPAKKGRTDIPC